LKNKNKLNIKKIFKIRSNEKNNLRN